MVCGVISRLPQMVVLQIQTNRLYFHEILDSIINLNGYIAKCATDTEFTCDFRVFLKAKDIR